MTLVITVLITFLACFIGTICGMGGGIIIKPVLDVLGIMSAKAITFTSGVTVICMTVWNMIKVFMKKESEVELKSTSFIAIFAAVGGLCGKALFAKVTTLFPSQEMATMVQSFVLIIATFLTLIYTINKAKIQSKNVESVVAISIIGFLLGTFGAFLGVGGGPFNVAVLFYFFSMATKKASQNSLFVILFCQTASTLKTVFSGNIPAFDPMVLVLMIIVGILGNEMGRKLSKKLDDKTATRCFEWAMVLIMLINVYNIAKYIF